MAGRAASAGGTGSAADFVPPRPTLPALREAARGCRGCHLYRVGTQTVFGEGTRRARVMFVGEQPGDVEDREGRPFVGPSGLLLDRALEEAGIARDEVYVTNAVKHFKWTRGEKSARRIHKKPSAAEVRACRPWLEQEIALVRPDAIVCLGATAAQALLGRDFRVTASRGTALESDWARAVFATVHPSAVLRAPREERASAEQAFFADVAKVARWMAKERLLERHEPPRADRERAIPSATEARTKKARSVAPRRPRSELGATRD
jgi:DNA polymerase